MGEASVMKTSSRLLLSAFPILLGACFSITAEQSVSAQSDTSRTQGTHSVLDRSSVPKSKISQTANSVEKNAAQKANSNAAQKKATKPPAIDSRRVILSPQQRQIKRTTPITKRPNRPLHFYGNTVRRRAAGGRAIFNRGTRR